MRSGLGLYSQCGGSPWRVKEDGNSGRGCVGARLRLPLRTMQFHRDRQVAGLSLVSSSESFPGPEVRGFLLTPQRVRSSRATWSLGVSEFCSSCRGPTRAEPHLVGTFYTSGWATHSVWAALPVPHPRPDSLVLQPGSHRPVWPSLSSLPSCHLGTGHLGDLSGDCALSGLPPPADTSL